jgi:NADPH:quinone reductase-like Zn-dependent oxidoreductase
MRAYVLQTPGAEPRLVDAPRPDIGPGDVLVRIAGSSINPHDAHVISGSAGAYLEYRFPVTLGNDFVGTVVEVGREVSCVEPGDEVFGVSLEAIAHRGTFAEYAAVPAQCVARRPANVEKLQAGVLGLAAIAALACVDAVDPVPGERVLINGATGGVGSYATQVVDASLACAICTARPGAEEQYVRNLGAYETIDWSAGDVATEVRQRHPDGIDGLIDLINIDPAGFAELAGGVLNDSTVANVIASPNRTQLDRVAVLAETGVLRGWPSHIFDLEQLPDALAASSEGAVGKIAIRISQPDGPMRQETR